MLDLDVRHLFEKSETRLKELELIKLTQSSNASKKHRAALAEWVEARATAIALEWIAAHAAEIIVYATEPNIPVEVPSDEPLPQVTKPIPYEFWRTLERRARRKTG